MHGGSYVGRRGGQADSCTLAIMDSASFDKSKDKLPTLFITAPSADSQRVSSLAASRSSCPCQVSELGFHLKREGPAEARSAAYAHIICLKKTCLM